MTPSKKMRPLMALFVLGLACWATWGLPALLLAQPASAPGELMASEGEKPLTAEEDAELQKLIDEGFAVSVSVESITLTATVRDRKGRYRTDLEKDDFVLYIDGLRTQIQDFRLAENDPLDLAVLLDVSGSMRFDEKIKKARWVLEQITNTLREDDYVALMFFADGRIETVVPFTADKSVFMKTLDEVQAYGKTALSDAMHEAAALVEEHGGVAPSILLITDGFENASELTLEQALQRLQWRRVPVYTMAVVARHVRDSATHPDAGSDFAILHRIAEQTGGRFFTVTTVASMVVAVQGIERDLRARYRMTFEGRDDEKDGPRLVELKVPGKNYTIRYRRGYRP